MFTSRETHGRIYRRVVAAAAIVFVSIAAPVTIAQAATPDRFRFDDSGDFVQEDFCGDQTVRWEFHVWGSGVGRIAGRERAVHYTVTAHGDATITNLATGKAFTLTWEDQSQDMRVLDNGDGTLSLFGNSGGAERTRGPDGQLLNVKRGLTQWMVLIDHGGTPTDPSDDEFISLTFLGGPGPHETPSYPEFCDAFRALTG
jgi:hypothetical protein